MRVFISYRRQDTGPLVDRLYQALTAAFGTGSVFRDLDSIPVGTDFRTAIRRAVDGSDVTLAVIGPGWAGAPPAGTRRIDEPNDFVRLEIEAALKGGKFVVPLLTPGGAIPPEADLPDGLRELTYRNGVPLRPDPDFTADVNRLITSLRGLRERAADPTDPPPATVPLRKQLYSVALDGDRHVIRFMGSFVDEGSVKAVKQELLEYLQTHQVKHLTLNLREVRFLSSSMVAVLMRLFRHVQTVGGDIQTVEVPVTIAELFRIMRIDRILNIPPED